MQFKRLLNQIHKKTLLNPIDKQRIVSKLIFVDILLLFHSKYNNSQLWDGLMLSCLEKGNY